jgi:hypothetical protein
MQQFGHIFSSKETNVEEAVDINQLCIILLSSKNLLLLTNS